MDSSTNRIAPRIVKLPESNRGFVLLPRRWIGERAFAWAARFRRMAEDDERLPTTLAGLHLVVLALPMLARHADGSPHSPRGAPTSPFGDRAAG